MWWLVNHRCLKVCCGHSGQSLPLAVGRMHKTICFTLPRAAVRGGTAEAQQALFLLPFHLVWPVGSDPPAPAKLDRFGASTPMRVAGTALSCRVNGVCDYRCYQARWRSSPGAWDAAGNQLLLCFLGACFSRGVGLGKKGYSSCCREMRWVCRSGDGR